MTPLGEELRELRAAFLSRLAVERFLGYMHSQHERMLGQSKRNVPNRPELIERYGWDVKYGSHALRLAYQGFEIASNGSLSLPLPDRERERVLAVKRGEVARDEVSAEISRLELAVRALLDEDRSPLPHTADLDRITTWAIDAQRRTTFYKPEISSGGRIVGWAATCDHARAGGRRWHTSARRERSERSIG